MKTIEFVGKLKSVGILVEIEQNYVFVFYNDIPIAEISRNDDNLADIYLIEYNEIIIPDEMKRKVFLDAVHDYATTPLEERDNDDSEAVDMKISYGKLGMILDCLESSIQHTELTYDTALLKPLYFSLLDLWGDNAGFHKGDTDESNN